jgi:hypothetical protein
VAIKKVGLRPKNEELYVLRVLRTSKRSVTYPVSGETLQKLLKIGLIPYRNFNNGSVACFYGHSLISEIIEARRELMSGEGFQVWEELRRFTDVIRPTLRGAGSVGYLQVAKIGTVKNPPLKDKVLLLTPLDGDLTRTVKLELAKEEYDIIITSMRYGSYIQRDTGLTISPEKPIVFKKHFIHGAEREEAGWDNVSIPVELKEKLGVMDDFAEDGTTFQITQYLRK